MASSSISICSLNEFSTFPTKVAIIFWKSQSPWPALRGNFYDYYQEKTGGFYGVKKALSANKLHVQLNPQTLKVSLINKLPITYENVVIQAKIFDFFGNVISSRQYTCSLLKNNSVYTFEAPLKWPADDVYDDDVLLFILSISSGKFFQIIGKSRVETSLQDFTENVFLPERERVEIEFSNKHNKKNKYQPIKILRKTKKTFANLLENIYLQNCNDIYCQKSCKNSKNKWLKSFTKKRKEQLVEQGAISGCRDLIKEFPEYYKNI